MTSGKKDLVLRIKKIKDIIKRKHRILKNRSINSEREAEIKYKPLIEPIKHFLTKQEPVAKTTIEERSIENETYEEEPVEKQPVEKEAEWVAYTRSKNIGSKVAKYLKKFVDDNGDYDLTYGMKWSENEWKLGQYTVTFQGDNIVINDITYPATNGLLQLVFLKEPTDYDDTDLATYKRLLEHSNAHLKSDGKVNTNVGFKYKYIVKKLFPPKSGKGLPVMSVQHWKDVNNKTPQLMEMSNSRVDYRHWDDPNELVDRLRLLIASKNAGNTGHSNEIISILEELQEAGIIKDFDNVQM